MPNLPRALFRGYPLYGTTQVRANISNKAITSNLATLTTAAAHGITQVGTIVTVRGVDSTFDGTWVVQSIPTSTTFTFVSTTATVASAAVSPVGVAIFNSAVTNGFTVTNKVAQNNVATLTTSSAHGLAVNDIVAVTIGDTIYDTLQAQVIAVPSTTTFSYVISTASGSTTAVTQGAYGRLPALYTVPGATTSVATNLVVTNISGAAATFTLVVDGVPIALSQALSAGSSAYFDVRQALATGRTIVGSANTPNVTFNLTGMEIS